MIKHKDKNRIAVSFEKDRALIERIKQFEWASWSQQKKVLHLTDTVENRDHFKITPYENTIPSPKGMDQIRKFTQWLSSKRFSPSIKKKCTEALKSF